MIYCSLSGSQALNAAGQDAIRYTFRLSSCVQSCHIYVQYAEDGKEDMYDK